jgi:hypothetical protein
MLVLQFTPLTAVCFHLVIVRTAAYTSTSVPLVEAASIPLHIDPLDSSTARATSMLDMPSLSVASTSSLPPSKRPNPEAANANEAAGLEA